MAKLIYMTIMEGFPPQLYTAVSYAPGYSKRSLSLTTPDRGDVILIDRYDGVVWPPPELAVLNSLGLGPAEDNVFLVNFNHRISWPDNKRENKRIIAELKKREFGEMSVFTGKSTISHLLARELGIPLMTADAETTAWAESKQTFRLLNDKYHFSPRGFICHDNEEIRTSWQKLQSLSGFCGLAAVKASQAASGVVSSIVSGREELERFLGQIDFVKLDGAVVEEWPESDPRSPSINYNVSSSGEAQEAFITDQIFEDDDKIVYGEEGTRIHRGNRYPSTFDAAVLDEIRTKTRIYLNEIISRGYWGPVGFDTIVLPDKPVGECVLVTEINPRMTGPRFAYAPMSFLGCGAFRLRNEDKISKILTAEDIAKRLSPALFNRDAREGFVFFNFFPGKFAGLTLAPDSKKLEEVVKRVDKLLPGLQ